MNCELDHLVVVARNLQQGAAWCEATFGVAPGPGGQHALMGTHNRLLAIASPAFARAYLEIIAIDPDAPPPARARWFAMDDAALQAGLAGGPVLHHAVLRCADIASRQAALIAHGLAPGRILTAERATPAGRLSWQILVRDDGRIEADGALPTLIAWDGAHPTDHLPASPVRLTALRVRRLPEAASGVLAWHGPDFIAPPAPTWQAVFTTPRGEVTLTSPT